MNPYTRHRYIAFLLIIVVVSSLILYYLTRRGEDIVNNSYISISYLYIKSILFNINNGVLNISVNMYGSNILILQIYINIYVIAEKLNIIYNDSFVSAIYYAEIYQWFTVKLYEICGSCGLSNTSDKYSWYCPSRIVLFYYWNNLFITIKYFDKENGLVRYVGLNLSRYIIDDYYWFICNMSSRGEACGGCEYVVDVNERYG